METQSSHDILPDSLGSRSRRLLITVLIALGLLVLFNIFFSFVGYHLKTQAEGENLLRMYETEDKAHYARIW